MLICNQQQIPKRRKPKTMKRFVAICLLVVCVALPLLSWGAAANQCRKCGSHHVMINVKTASPHTWTPQCHTSHETTTTLCLETNCKATSRITRHVDAPHTLKHTVIDRMPNLNLKQVKHACTSCGYYYTTYEPIDPTKPYVLP